MMELLKVVKDFILSIPSRVDITSPSTWAGIGIGVIGLLMLILGNVALGLLTIIAGSLAVFIIEKNKSD
tara:strand:- start:1429 stop:1635 length:207 start_codon:yes stop_codon:yes gene_type:complete